MKHILTLCILLLSTMSIFATDYLAEAEYYQKKADGYRREAEYYEKKAKGYEREDVPEESVDLYKSTSQWREFTNINAL